MAIEKRSNGSYTVRFRRNGSSITVGTFDSEEEARLRNEEYLEAQRPIVFTAITPEAIEDVPRRIPVPSFMKRFIERIKG